MIQEQYEEIFEAIFISKGSVGVGYRLFNDVHYARTMFMAKNKEQKGIYPVINDYSIMFNKCSEFLYLPIDFVEAFSMRRWRFKQLLEMPAARHMKGEI